MPIGRQLSRTKSDFADNSSSVRTNWVESGLSGASLDGTDHGFPATKICRKGPAVGQAGARELGNRHLEATICMKTKGLIGNSRDPQEIVCF